MDQSKGAAYFQWVMQLHAEKEDIRSGYVSLRRLLEKACRELTDQELTYFPNLFSRLNFICRKRQLGKNTTFRINSLRIRANNVLHEDLKPSENVYLQDLRALCDFFTLTFSYPIPSELDAWLPKATSPEKKDLARWKEVVRGEVTGKEGHTLFVLDADDPQGEEWRVECHVRGTNDAFNATFDVVWPGCQINLLDVTITSEGVLIPKMLVLEPDYLFDITSIAETHKDYGYHPLNAILDRFSPVSTNIHRIKGTIANHIFDKFISGGSADELSFAACMKESFRQSAFDLTACRELEIKKTSDEFFKQLKEQYKHIAFAVKTWFQGGEYGLDKDKAIVEPTFLCEKLGIQGRMDFIHSDYSALVELKAGRADDFNKALSTKHNHYIQLLLYLAVMRYSLGKDPDAIRAFIFYSKYPCLSEESADISILKRAINLRNCMLANEYRTVSDEGFARTLIDKIYPDQLNTFQLDNALWHRYLAPGIVEFKKVFEQASPLELDYFYAFYTFVVREQFLAKLQIHRLEDVREGSYWTDFSSKKESGDILFDLDFAPEGHRVSGAEGTPSVTFRIPAMEREMLPNFRAGDIILFYERNNPSDNATNKQVFKGTIASIDQANVHIVLKFRQKNPNVLPLQSKYAVEHDYMDASGLSMFRALYSFLQANQDRKELILHPNSPIAGCTESRYETDKKDVQDMEYIVRKAREASSLFLLSGPPGTGKTSKALKALVEDWIQRDPNHRVLLLSYTNRAVDEICETLEKMEGNPDYIRIGNALSCDPAFHHRLLDAKLAQTEKREEVRNMLSQHRIFAGTVASVNHKQGLFNLVSFDVVMIDEASQILEPSLLGILCAKNPQGQNAVGKIIMIGDTRQLPAVVLQEGTASAIQQESLLNIGLRDRRESLFERWHRLLDKNAPNVSMLQKQGRMHDHIAAFPNQAFYRGQLEIVPTQLQLSDLPFKTEIPKTRLQEALIQKRILFIPSTGEPQPGYKSSQNVKIHPQEASIIARCLSEIELLCNQNALQLAASESPSPGSLSVGIITPYRRQIALIRNELRKAGIVIADSITIDTVERYQGSQRDIILFSFCLNSADQLDQLTSTFVDDDVVIDRKFNVALTRAKQQLIITGNPTLMKQNLVFSDWLDYVASEEGILHPD